MSMFDMVTFRHCMPDGHIEGSDGYQTKDLRFGMDMASYEVTDEGRLIRTSSDLGQPLGDVCFNHTLTISAGNHSYDLTFTDGVLQTIHCFQTDRAVPFKKRSEAL
ncbi:hypothetical protein E2P84_43030 [Burkholderia cepacia]|uniref:Uncharacterized protein n=1 Tax=Burkholderia cepacia TaxID=292 RepID=A0AAX2RNB2_BURCE|nr:hypothetical protein [Burkholderia cepacia]TES61937.1 hypothetical protein E2P84_43030 [Burkholderia cepacia]TET01582.1 hypothetical protein E3D36_16215 [Burkholderia cepacia]TEU47594.1 hypothetical protein E3D37_16450 [Burkholderia cepacia]TEU53466.1 hypothetical protein E3D38_12035 [Burkholderia cepacia]TEV02072.1 hypothetical protein E3D40_12965 [Burkholderia cepacia]